MSRRVTSQIALINRSNATFYRQKYFRSLCRIADTASIRHANFLCRALRTVGHETDIQPAGIVHRTRIEILRNALTSCNRRTISSSRFTARVDDERRSRAGYESPPGASVKMRVCHVKARTVTSHYERVRGTVTRRRKLGPGRVQRALCYALHFRFHCARFEGVARPGSSGPQITDQCVIQIRR